MTNEKKLSNELRDWKHQNWERQYASAAATLRKTYAERDSLAAEVERLCAGLVGSRKSMGERINALTLTVDDLHVENAALKNSVKAAETKLMRIRALVIPSSECTCKGKVLHNVSPQTLLAIIDGEGSDSK